MSLAGGVECSLPASVTDWCICQLYLPLSLLLSGSNTSQFALSAERSLYFYVCGQCASCCIGQWTLTRSAALIPRKPYQLCGTNILFDSCARFMLLAVQTVLLGMVCTAPLVSGGDPAVRWTIVSGLQTAAVHADTVGVLLLLVLVAVSVLVAPVARLGLQWSRLINVDHWLIGSGTQVLSAASQMDVMLVACGLISVELPELSANVSTQLKEQLSTAEQLRVQQTQYSFQLEYGFFVAILYVLSSWLANDLLDSDDQQIQMIKKAMNVADYGSCNNVIVTIGRNR